jgi:hypothetical protein
MKFKKEAKEILNDPKIKRLMLKAKLAKYRHDKGLPPLTEKERCENLFKALGLPEELLEQAGSPNYANAKNLNNIEMQSVINDMEAEQQEEEELLKQIDDLMIQGHPYYCAKRQIWGDGECVCELYKKVKPLWGDDEQS